MFVLHFLFISVHSTHILLGLLSPGSAEANVGWSRKVNSHLMAIYVRNSCIRNNQNLIIILQVTVKNVVCQKLLNLVEIWWSSDKNKLGIFLAHPVVKFCAENGATSFDTAARLAVYNDCHSPHYPWLHSSSSSLFHRRSLHAMAGRGASRTSYEPSESSKTNVKGVHSYSQKRFSELKSITCHMGSHSATHHPIQVNVPCHNPSQTGRYLIYLAWRDGRLSWPCCWRCFTCL